MPKLNREYHRSNWSRYSQEQIEVIAPALLAIQQEFGEVTITNVLRVAKKASHPLHPFLYGVSDAEAAAFWRVDEVRRLCRAVEVRYVDDLGEEKYRGPLMVSIRSISPKDAADEAEADALSRVYRSTESALADPVTRKEVLAEALRMAEQFMARYRHLTELAPVFAAIEKVSRRRRRSA